MTENQKNHLGQIIGGSVPNWNGATVPDGRILEGHYSTLERLDVKHHGPDLYKSYCLDSEGRNWTYLPYGPFETVEDFMAWLSMFQDNADPFFYVVKRKEDGAVLGQASFLRITPDAGSIEVGHIHFSPALQRTTLSTETMYLMMKHIFEDLGYRRYEWKCNNLNEASKKAALRYGFTFEGVFRQMGVVKGHNRDTAWFSILDKEWRSVKAGFEKWLSPDNFNEDGSQKTPLKFDRS